MPEHAELRITSEFVSKIAKNTEFTHITKSEKSKVKTDLTAFENKKFTVKSESRGKEMKLILESEDGESKELMIFLGMSGTFVNVRNEAAKETKDKFLKHAHLRIHSDAGILAFYDVRRFGKWKWIENGKWSSNRGYDPVTEHEKFKASILENYKEHKAFKSLVVHMLMNQQWFNGIGNYLRSEIVYRVPGLNPWTPFNELTEDQVLGIIQQCYECPMAAYQLQGGQFKDWKNPFSENEDNRFKKVEEKNIVSWRKIYGVKESSYITDGNGRRFWFHSDLNSQVPEKFLKGKFKLKE